MVAHRQQEFVIQVCAGETFDGLIAAGKYDWKDKAITRSRFPVRQSALGERKLVLRHFARDVLDKEVIVEAAKQGLVLPTYEDCFRFGMQYPEVQRQIPIVFLHESVRIHGFAQTLSLYRNDWGRSLHRTWRWIGWGYDCRFAFVQP
jgi:hypothetical protein